MTEAQPDHDGGPTMKEFIELRDQVFRTDETVTRIAAAAARLEGDVFEIKRDVSELKGPNVKFDRFQAVLDGMTRQMDSFERTLEPKPQ